MPVMPDTALFTASPYVPADRDAGNSPTLGASRRLIPASPAVAAKATADERQRRIDWKRIEQSVAFFEQERQMPQEETMRLVAELVDSGQKAR
jgi:hypothetical protein